MKLGRLILTHRKDYIEKLKRFYLDGGRTDFLVIAPNQKTADPSKFVTTDTFHLVPYCGRGERFGQPCGVSGQQFRVWVDVVKRFPEIEGWVVHDYDFACRVSDKEIMSHVKPNEYAMIGKAFPVWQEGMKENEGIDTYPFIQDHRHTHNQIPLGPIDAKVYATLMNAFPHYYHGIRTPLCGYGDFIATSRENFLLLDDPALKDLEFGGIEQVPHTIWGVKGITPVDMHPLYRMKILLDVVYVPMDARYDMIHPAKVWEGESPTLVERWKNSKWKFKNLIKWLIGYHGWKKKP